MDRFVRLPVVLALACIVLAGQAAYFNHVVDDAFISFRYLHNALAGHGLVFNPGERVEGYTNFLWIAVLAPAAALGLPLPRTAAVLGVLCMGAAVGVRWRLADREAAAAAAPDARARALQAAGLLACWGPMAYWAAAGLETGLFCFLLVLMLRYAQDLAPRPAAAAGICAALLCMTRPDGVVHVAAVVLWLWLRNGDAPTRAAGRVAAGGMVGAFVLVFGPYFVWRWLYYDAFLPNTFYAKVGGPAIPRGLTYVASFVPLSGMGALVAVCGLVALRRGGPGAAPAAGNARLGRLFLLTSAAGLAFVIAVGGDQLAMFRFMTPIVLLAFPSLWSAATGRLASPRTQTLAVVAALACVLAPSFVGPMRARVFRSERPADRDRAAIGRWLHRTQPPDTLIAVVPAGILPYYAELPTLDLVGLTDRHIARADVAGMGEGAPGHERYDPDYVLQREPDLVFLGACRLWEAPLSADELTRYVRSYAEFVPAVGALLNHSDFAAAYAPRVLVIDGRYAHVWVRRPDTRPTP